MNARTFPSTVARKPFNCCSAAAPSLLASAGARRNCTSILRPAGVDVSRYATCGVPDTVFGMPSTARAFQPAARSAADEAAAVWLAPPPEPPPEPPSSPDPPQPAAAVSSATARPHPTSRARRTPRIPGACGSITSCVGTRARPTGTPRPRPRIDVLSQHGLRAIAVEPLALQIGVTKGSFYAHFTTRDDLIAAVLTRWEAIDTDQTIRDVERIADPRQRLARLLELNFERPRWGRVFAALCASVDDPRVKPTMDRVYRRRLAYFEQALLELGVQPAEAQDRAVLIYTAYVGFWRIIAADPAGSCTAASACTATPSTSSPR